MDGWRKGKTVIECNLHMFTSGDWSDVIFRVGPEKHVVRAHSYVLISRSSVFAAKLCNQQGGEREITLPDIEVGIFKQFLRFVYTDEVEITGENVQELLMTAKRYEMDVLSSRCVHFLTSSLADHNVCDILEFCHQFDERVLELRALKKLSEGGKKVIHSQGYPRLCSGCLKVFVSSENIRLEENEIFNAVMFWGREKCRAERVAPTSENIRRFLGVCRYEIRFSEFSPRFIANVVIPSGVLTDEEWNYVQNGTVSRYTFQPQFRKGPRKGHLNVSPTFHTTRHIVNRFSSVSRGSSACGNRTDCLLFTTTKDICLLGCQLYGAAERSESSYQISARLLTEHGELLAEVLPRQNLTLRGTGETNDVKFEEPGLIVAGQVYSLTVYRTGEPTNVGKEGSSVLESKCVLFTFRGSQVDRGQIPGLIWQ